MRVFAPIMAGHVTHRRAIRLTAFLAVMASTFLALAATATANNGFSFTPSKTEPFAVCGNPQPGHAACFAIIVPTASSRRLAHPGAMSAELNAELNAEPNYEGSGVGGGFDPADLQSAYNLPSSSSGSGQTVAIVDAYDDPDAESDLAKYRSRYSLSACTTENGCFKKVNQSGGTTYPSPNASWAVEISLDLDMVSAACPHCHILLVEATTNSYGNLLTAEDEAVALGATEISNSWGGEEFSGETSDDEYFHHRGVDITAAAGDHGYEVEYPAASQYVTAVGGTVLKKASNSRGWSETAWSGTGSGCSAYEPKPPWQHDTGCSHRTNNDVSAVASTETPVSVADSYELPSGFFEVEPGWTLVGGTSVASPLIASTLALTDPYTRSFGADAFYEQARENGTGVLDDVVSGSNGSCGTYLCNAVAGYDGPTGLGTPYGAPTVTPHGSSPFVTYNPTTHQEWVNYVGSDGGMWQLYFEPSTGKWLGPNEYAGTAGKVASGTSPFVTYNPTTHQEWVYFQGSDGGMWQLYFEPSTGKWLGPNEFTGTAGKVAPGTSPFVTQNPTTHQEWVNYVGSDGGIWQLYWNGESGKWAGPNEYAGTAGKVAPGTSPFVTYNPTTHQEWVNYVGSDGGMWQLYFEPSTGKWLGPNEYAGTAGKVASGTSPFVTQNPTTHQEWVNYVGSDGGMWQLYFEPSTGKWLGPNEYAGTAGKVAPGTSPFVTYNPTTHQEWVNFQGSDGGMWQLYFEPSTGKWLGPNEFTGTAGKVAPGTSPFVTQNPTTHQEWVNYRGTDGGIWQLYFESSTGKWLGPNEYAGT